MNRRAFMKQFVAAATLAGRGVFAQSPTKPVEDIVVSPAALNDIAITYFKVAQNLSVRPPTNATRQEFYKDLETFNARLESRGYAKRNIHVGALYMERASYSIRIGGESAVILSQLTFDNGKSPTILAEAHEFGHLYRQHTLNKLIELHPQFYTGKHPEILRLQRDYKSLFNQVDLLRELPLLLKLPKQDNYTQEKQAEEMAVRLTCLQELSLRTSQQVLADIKIAKPDSPFFKMPKVEQEKFISGIKGQIDGAKTPLPFVCAPVRQSPKI